MTKADLDGALLKLANEHGAELVLARARAILVPARKRSKKRSAVATVEEMTALPEHKRRLHELALRFDEKRFLPTSGTLRQFFESVGQVVPVSIKSRQNAISFTFKFLASLPDQKLDEIISNRTFAGPSSLTAISEAIRANGPKISSP
jgi:hypothetical protein